MGVRNESAASEAWLTLPPIWPITISAETPFVVGMLLNSRTRSLPPSAINSRLPAASAKRGKLTVALQAFGEVGLVENALLAIELTRSGWPTATSAACPLAVGIEFQMSTRL